MAKHTYDNLFGKKIHELEDIKKELMEELHQLQLQKNMLIGNILSLQGTLEFERSLTANNQL